jgi:hypothetical protein
MDNSAVQYAGFIVAALIIIWGVIEINRRYFSRRKMDARSLNTWVHLDANQPDAPEGAQPASASDDEAADNSEQDIQTRARQNGHYSESKRAF